MKMKTEALKQRIAKKMTAQEKTEFIQEQLQIILEQVKEGLRAFVAPCQRIIILHVSKGSKPRKDISGDITCGVEKLKKLFGNFDIGFRNEILSVYLEKILPPLEVEYNKEVEEQDATNELLALTTGKTAQEIKAMIEVLKTSEVLALV
jgi:hypothetical protein